mgnify:CR=1 FL=1
MKRTKGLVCTVTENQKKDKNRKLFFFEIDFFSLELRNKILDVYEKNKLDVIFHRTGGSGIHFLSPTLINLKKWKEIHSELLLINKRCPMICLRILGNKYPNENVFFYKCGVRINSTPDKNIESLCLYLNKIFDFEPRLKGKLSGSPVVVEYTPKIEVKE